MDGSLYSQAQSLLARLTAQCSAGHDFGSMSPSIYDTAWVSMVQKPKNTWLFPECFEFILAKQLPSGAWDSYASAVDGILNTAAALLALKKHLRACPDHPEWIHRSERAEAALARMLGCWDASSSDQVGFEMLVIQHLSLLQDEGVVLYFPQMSTLQYLRASKLSQLPPSSVHGAPSTLYHSLEALIGHIDFDQVRRWRDANGSMMGSPSSTAAYLMNSSSWDDEAEAYLRNVLQFGTGRGDGSVPSAWPTSIFEISWAVTTLADAGCKIGEPAASTFGHFLQQALLEQQDTLGFAPGTFPDADDTAKGIAALFILKRSASVEGLLRMFEGKSHFKTYQNERNPSFSANCNVLVCLLMLEDPTPYVPQIAKAVSFLTNQAFKGEVHEKWHINELYWMMLLSQAFTYLYRVDKLPQTIFELCPDLEEKIPMVSLHILIKVLSCQTASGSWDTMCEVTSYAILTLSSLALLPWIQQLDLGNLVASIARGKSFLLSKRQQWSKGRHLWIEKVTYASDVLSETYCLAAIFAPIPSTAMSPPAESWTPQKLFVMPDRIMHGMRETGEMLENTPLLSKVEVHVVRAAEMQACYALCALQKNDLGIFPRSAKGKDKYLFIIPLALTACSASQGCSVSPFVLYEMMVLSVLNFLADEYMEGVIEKAFAGDLVTVKSLIRRLFVDVASEPEPRSTNYHIKEESSNLKGLVPGQDSWHDGLGGKVQVSLDDVRVTLGRFVKHILRHPASLASPKSYQSRLAFELETFLLAHVTHAEDNHGFGRQHAHHVDSNRISSGSNLQPFHGQHKDATQEIQERPIQQYLEPGRTFYNWVRSTSADHTSCPYSFVFFNCLIRTTSSPRSSVDIFGGSARTAYLAEDLCRHLASLCRMYNDYGSLGRDNDEGNLNSLNFPEFHQNYAQISLVSSSSLSGPELSHKAKPELLWIAEYERRGLQMALLHLEQGFCDSEGQWQGPQAQHVVNALKLFINVTDLYGQIYVLKDVGTRTK